MKRPSNIFFDHRITVLDAEQQDAGAKTDAIYRRDGISQATFYAWRSKYGGMDASMMSEMKSMAEENRRLKKMCAEMAMQNELLKHAPGKK